MINLKSFVNNLNINLNLGKDLIFFLIKNIKIIIIIEVERYISNILKIQK